MRRERFDAITDAILAIIATLMVLEIKLPALTAANLSALLGQIGVYAISFTMICILWLNHHHIFSAIKTVDTNTIWLNFLLLFIVSLLPIATRMLSESFLNYGPHMFYGAVLSCATLMYAILEERAMLLSTGVLNEKSHKFNWLSTAVCFSSIPLSLLSVYLSGLIFFLIPASYFLISAKFIRNGR